MKTINILMTIATKAVFSSDMEEIFKGFSIDIQEAIKNNRANDIRFLLDAKKQKFPDMSRNARL